MSEAKYAHREIESKWLKKWEDEELNKTDLLGAKRPFYNLMMFPYPSAEGLHVGNMYAFTAADIYGRFKRMQGFDVFEPIGLDGFGIHSENYALKIGRHPKEHAQITQENFYKQLHQVGNMFDWSKTLETYDPEYYKWTQWIFIQMYKAGLAYRAKSEVNWCPHCKTVLADEQVIDGKCERCKSEMVRKELEQWFFRITKYAQRLLDNLDKLDWVQNIKTSQKNWIGRSEGMKLKFGKYEVFTTRPDTLHGATFLALAGKKDRFTGEMVINPATGKEIPVWEAVYVVADYGTGVIMGVPAHDERDMVFAKKHGIEVVEMEPDKSMEKYGEKTTHYHLRDWLISRQRYWGPPIPMINCPKCGWQPVPEKDLPVLLPDISDYQPEGEGKGPLAKHPEFYKTACPVCGGNAERETDVSDTFLDSAWYFLRYPSIRSAHSGQLPFDSEITKKWMPVHMYTGGAEHANLHLLYTRFLTMALHDLGYVPFEEPFKRFFAHGMIVKDGAKMSKSKGNVVNPDDYIAKYGADALRLYFMFLGPIDQGGDFRDAGMEGMARFVNRVYRLFDLPEAKSEDIVKAEQRLIKKVGEDIERRHYNTAIAAMMEYINLINGIGGWTKEQKGILAIMLAPLAPFLAEELWFKLAHKDSVHLQAWPKYDPGLAVQERGVIAIQVNGKMRDRVEDGPDVEQRALQSDKIKKFIGGAKYRTIFVPGKVINFVLNGK
ncbi:MAG: class I tRNA ligase family protein [Patescibacteria group bacterium]